MTTTANPTAWIDEVSSETLMETARGISQWVRLSGTDDEQKAFDLIDEMLRGYGLETTLHKPTCLVSLPIEGHFSVDGETYHAITHSFSTQTPPDGVAGELVFGGDGSDQELAAADARGRIAIVQGLATPQKAVSATRAGVKALVCISGDQIHEMIVSPVWGSPTTETLDDLPKTPIVSIDSETGERLVRRLTDTRCRAVVKTVVDTRWRQIPVLVADLAVNDRDYVMFSGHVDSWHYGAMDNATANATMIEVARILSTRPETLRRGVRFAFWSGHSHARYAGSTWFADRYWFDLRDRCVAHVNVDSTGGKGASDLATANSMADTYELAKEVIRRQTGQELFYQRFGRAGDQSFWGIGLPAFFMSLSHQGEASDVSGDMVRLLGGTSARGGGLGWWWHTTEDTIDKIDPENLNRDTRVYVEVLGRLACDPVVPVDLRGPVTELIAEFEDIEPLWRRLPANGEDDRPPFAELRSELDELRESAGKLHELTQRGDLSEPDAAQLSWAKCEACKILLPVNYTVKGEFEHDPALGASPIPSIRPPTDLIAMDENELWAASHGLRRALNRVIWHVRSANDVVGSALS